ncbi:unnamed protein product [Dicrocoelium dendriticum]|nr:unnamed protein product [Dicrocoelium dendriticum]
MPFELSHVWLALTLFRSLLVQSQYIYVHPEARVISQAMYSTMYLCIGYQKEKFCSADRKARFAPASCKMDLTTSFGKIDKQISFNHTLSLGQLEPGVYQIVCQFHSGRQFNQQRRLIVRDGKTRLDCSAFVSKFTVTSEKRVTPTCCLRIAVRTVWVQYMHPRVRWCSNSLKCTVDLREAVIGQGVIYFPTDVSFATSSVLVECYGGRFKETLLLLTSHSVALDIEPEPREKILFSNLERNLSFHLKVPRKNSVSPVHYVSRQPVACNMTRTYSHKDLPHTSFHFLSSIGLEQKQVIEGEYTIDCYHPETDLHRKFTRYILHHGSYHWDCSMAPHVIYLEEIVNQEHLICTWKLNASDQWIQSLTNVETLEKPFDCTDDKGKLEFINGVLLVSRGQRNVGTYLINCRGLVVVPCLLITNSRNDLDISIHPSSTLIGKHVSDIIWPRLEWHHGTDRSQLHVLRTHFPVRCFCCNSTAKKPLSFSFAEPFQIGQLPNGLLEFHCFAEGLDVQRRFQKFVVHLSGSLHERIGPNNSHRKTLVRSVQYTWNTDCFEPSGEFEMMTEALKLTVAPITETEEDILCTGYEHNIIMYFRDSDLYLSASPAQSFYIFDQRPPLQLHISCMNATRQQANLLRSIPLECSVRDAKGESVNVKRGFNTSAGTNMASFTSTAESLVTGRYHYACSAFSHRLLLDISLILVDRSTVLLQLRFIGQESLAYDQEAERPVIECHTNHLGTLDIGPPIWRQLHGKAVYSLKDRTSLTIGISVLHVTDRRPGVTALQCSMELQGVCVSKLAVFWTRRSQPAVIMQPMRRIHGINTQVVCQPKQDDGLFYSMRIGLITSSHGKIDHISSSIRWVGDRKSATSVVIIGCFMSVRYMERKYDDIQLHLSAEVWPTIALRVVPELISVEHLRPIQCMAETKDATGFRPMLTIMHGPDFLHDGTRLTDTLSFTRLPSGGKYAYECRIFIPEVDPVVIEGLLEIEGKFSQLPLFIAE